MYYCNRYANSNTKYTRQVNDDFPILHIGYLNIKYYTKKRQIHTRSVMISQIIPVLFFHPPCAKSNVGQLVQRPSETLA